VTHRIESGPLRDGMAMDARELATALMMSERQVKVSLVELVEKGFVVNLTPELSVDKAVFRLTMFPFQGRPPTHDYLTPEERSRLQRWMAPRRMAGGGK
jgi:predicted ArsR family transcriptional regulator